jgi:hypothetical protein
MPLMSVLSGAILIGSLVMTQQIEKQWYTDSSASFCSMIDELASINTATRR